MSTITIEETAQVFAKAQLIDNREASNLVLLEWHDILDGRITFEQAIAAVREFRRTRPGVYLEPGHLLELAGVEAESHIPDLTPELLAADRAAQLAAVGVTEAEYEAHAHDGEWLRIKFPKQVTRG